ncbi:MAG: methylmalonyl-CoA mutase small subunit, partial [Bacteroidales bacterium]|nr:methylmalonyl-CoA mutase small subunit [Bacteroidales bacterium]
MTDEKLFTEFPPVSTEQWEATINKDLKGADYEKKLVWRTDEGFQVRPYYRAENMQDLDYLKTMPNEFPYTRGTKARDNHWDIVQEIEEADPTKANAIAVDALKRGATCIAFNAANVESDEALATLLKDIDLNVNGVQFNHVKSYLDLMKRFVN